MSGAYNEWEERSMRGLSQIPDKDLCSEHINEDAIRLFINRTGDRGMCSYCGRRKAVVSLESLMYYITDALMHFYTDPANFMGYETKEGGYLGRVYYSFELLNQHIELDVTDNQLLSDIEDSLDASTPWANEYEYYNSEADYRMEDWDNFKKIVKTQSRYLFTTKKEFKLGDRLVNAFEVLKELGKTIKEQKMIKQLPVGAKLFRCRQHKKRSEVTEFSHITSPPEKAAIYPNRMSPAGISMFYAAFDMETATMETVEPLDKKNKYFTTACFKTKKELNVIDLSGLKMPSIFEQRQWKNYESISFLISFVNDFTKPIVKDGRTHIEYVPTQIVTEFFRYAFVWRRKTIDGIIYPSAKNKGKKACVLFCNQEESANKLRIVPASFKTTRI